MSFTQGEISKWAKSHGYKISKKDGLFFWSKLDNVEVCGKENSLEEVTKAVYNKITDNKWVEHQSNFKE